MGLLQTLKSILGIGGSDRRRDTGTTVTVEREPEPESDPEPEPDAATERAVKETDTGAAAVEEAEATESEAGEAEPDEAEADEAGDGEPVEEIKGIGPAYAERLGEAGVETVADLAAADAAALAEEADVSETRIQNWIERARAR